APAAAETGFYGAGGAPTWLSPCTCNAEVPVRDTGVFLRGCLVAFPAGHVDRPAKRDEAGFLDRLAQRRMRGHAVGDGLHGRLGVDRDHTGLNKVGHVWADHDQAQQLSVARFVDRLDPADGGVLHHRAGIRDPREPADGDVVAVLLARRGFGQADTRNLRVGVDRTRHRTVVDSGLVTERVLGRHLALTEGGVGELPVTGAVADRVDVPHGRPP